MSIKLRLTLLLGLLFAGFLAALVVLQKLERAERAELAERDRQTRTQLLNHWIDLAGRTLPQFAAEAAQSEELAALLAPPVLADAPAKVEAILARAGVASIWIVRGDGRLRYQAHAAGGNRRVDPPIEAATFASFVAETPNPRYFATVGTELVEVCIRRLRSNAATPEWLVAARFWDGQYLRTLSDLTESEVLLVGPHESVPTPAVGSPIVLVRTLCDWRGHPLRMLRVEYRAPEIERSLQADWRQTQVFLGFGLLVIVAMWLALQGWVLRPLARIGESLATDNPGAALALGGEKTELGRIARLVVSSFDQRAALQREISERAATQAALERSEATLQRNLEERARLGRDLHDGVIQSLYAAGMGLSGVRASLQPDQTEAAARLEQTRAALNETIHDVRNFLIGLEPEALKLQTFSQAVATLLQVMHPMRPFRSTVEIDESLAARLTLAQRVHALQIAREAVSNALRHGEANHIQVSLGLHRELVQFEIADDGRGFDALSLPPHGRGLNNFAQRARELGAELTVDSQPAQGTRVKLRFSLLIL